jgi:ABC-type transporter Mla subunit MlaD
MAIKAGEKMAFDIGPKIGIEGEKEFRQAITNINTTMKTLKTEMEAVSSQFDKNDKSQQAYAAKNDVLNKQIDTQKQKLDELKKGLEAAGEKYGENDKVTQGWQQAVNKATAELNNMERELDGNVKSMNTLGNEIEETANATENAGGRFEKFGGILKGMGVTLGTVAVAAGAAAIKLGKEVIQQFGELEQNLGGSEAVFGKYAASIQKTGEEAYKNLGVSQSDYLATANKMGALFQGSGVEQQKSLELTEKAMQRAADMASVMGIDMQVALDSVAGAAKGNFTMMDNLGVAMNATNIEAYALAKGLDFTWKTATQAEKAEVAMQMFFENTEQYAGNFAKESTQTISGSIGLLQAALGSFTAGLGNADADMKNLTGNLVDAFKAVVSNIVPVLENIVEALPEAMGAILEAIGEILPMLLETVTTLFEQVLETLLSLLPELIPAAVEAIMTVINTLIENLPLLITAASEIILALMRGLVQALPDLIPAIVEIMKTIVTTITGMIPEMIPLALEILLALGAGLIQAIPDLIISIPEIIGALLSALLEGIPKILGFVPELFSEMVKSFGKIDWAKLGKNIIDGIKEGVKSVATSLATSVGEAATGALNWAKSKLGIKSPSRVFRDEVGQMIGLGMAEGISDSARQVESAMAGLNNNLSANADIDISGGGRLRDTSGSSSSRSVVEHTGSIRVEGVNNQDQVISVVDIVLDTLRREVRA